MRCSSLWETLQHCAGAANTEELQRAILVTKCFILVSASAGIAFLARRLALALVAYLQRFVLLQRAVAALQALPPLAGKGVAWARDLVGLDAGGAQPQQAPDERSVAPQGERADRNASMYDAASGPAPDVRSNGAPRGDSAPAAAVSSTGRSVEAGSEPTSERERTEVVQRPQGAPVAGNGAGDGVLWRKGSRPAPSRRRPTWEERQQAQVLAGDADDSAPDEEQMLTLRSKRLSADPADDSAPNAESKGSSQQGHSNPAAASDGAERDSARPVPEATSSGGDTAIGGGAQAERAQRSGKGAGSVAQQWLQMSAASYVTPTMLRKRERKSEQAHSEQPLGSHNGSSGSAAQAQSGAGNDSRVTIGAVEALQAGGDPWFADRKDLASQGPDR